MAIHYIRIKKQSSNDTAAFFLYFIVFTILAWLLYELGHWSSGQDISTLFAAHKQQPFGFSEFVACLAYGAFGTSIGFSGIFFGSFMDHINVYGGGMIGFVFSIMLLWSPISVVVCIIILFNRGMVPFWL